MIISGLDKLTLIDFPGHLACIVFTQGCNWRCPFCHNPSILKVRPASELDKKGEEEFFNFLNSRRGKLEGVVITGGEPTLQSDLIPFIKKIREMGFLVKLDSNGTNPEKLAEILDSKLVDYVAMDIKNSPAKYSKTAGRKTDLQKIQKSINLLKAFKINYEFRTTVVPTFHTKKDILEIADWLEGSKNYFLQKFRPDVTLDPNLPAKIMMAKELNLEEVRNEIQDKFEFVGVR